MIEMKVFRNETDFANGVAARACITIFLGFGWNGIQRSLGIYILEMLRYVSGSQGVKHGFCYIGRLRMLLGSCSLSVCLVFTLLMPRSVQKVLDAWLFGFS